MAEQLVLCGEARGRSDALHLHLDGPGRNINLRIDQIAKRMAADVPAALTDLVELAAYVYCADRAVSRGGPTDPKTGAHWRRDFHFVVPVRDPARWSRPVVAVALTDALEFLSDDHYRFEFVKRRNPPSLEAYLPLSDGAKQKGGSVVMFSGGLDSLAGAIAELEAGRRVFLVTHHGSDKLLEVQSYLARELANRYLGKALHVPVEVSRHREGKPGEHTQRSRSFLFGVLGAAVACMVGTNSLLMCENGVAGINLPLSGQVLGGRATRTAHPRVLAGLEHLFERLLGRPVAVFNPLLWRTRTEVVEGVARAGHANLIRHTVSCSRVYGITKLQTHCGTCFQCLDRRFAILAGGQSVNDPEEMYAVDLLRGAREPGETVAMAVSYLRHNLDLARLSDLDLQGKFGSEIGRVVPYAGSRSADDAAKQILSLHRRQGDAVRRVLLAAVRDHAARLVDQELPATCILRMAIGTHELELDRAPEPSAQLRRLPAGAPSDCPELPEILVAAGDIGPVRVQGVRKPLKGDIAELLRLLATLLRGDVAAGRPPERCRYKKAAALAEELGVEEQTLRKRVLRLRKTIAKAIEEHCELALSGDAVVQNRAWHGYRLNPHVRLVAPSEWPAAVTT